MNADREAANETLNERGEWVPATPLPEPRIWRLWRWLRIMR